MINCLSCLFYLIHKCYMRRATTILLLALVAFSCFNFWLYLRLLKKSLKEEQYIIIPTASYGDRFCVAYNVTKAKRSFRDDGLEPISLSSHTTSLYLNLLEEQVQTWDGPISVALFIDRDSANAVPFLLNVRRCSANFAEKVSLHVVYQMAAFQELCEPIRVPRQSIACKNFTSRYKSWFLNHLIPPFGIYPINVVRNVARKGAPSYIQIVTDIEMIFSENFAMKAKKIANENVYKGSKRLIVVRRFELENNVHIPKNITILRNFIDTKMAHEFHHKLFPIGHTIEGLWQWFRRSTENVEPIVWEIRYKNPSWEPQFIMHASDPLSDEGIPTRQRDQQALSYELCRANYSFLLASRLFNVHRGVKRLATSMDSAVTSHQSRLKYRAFKKFKSRMDIMYPNTTSRCGMFVM